MVPGTLNLHTPDALAEGWTTGSAAARPMASRTPCSTVWVWRRQCYADPAARWLPTAFEAGNAGARATVCSFGSRAAPVQITSSPAHGSNAASAAFTIQPLHAGQRIGVFHGAERQAELLESPPRQRAVVQHLDVDVAGVVAGCAR